MLALGCGLEALEQGARERLLEAKGSLDSFFLAARALDAVGLVQGPRALGTGRLLEEEAAEVPPELCCPRRAEGDAARGTARESPCGVDKLGDASEPLLIEVIDGAVVQ